MPRYLPQSSILQHRQLMFLSNVWVSDGGSNKRPEETLHNLYSSVDVRRVLNYNKQQCCCMWSLCTLR